MFILLATESLCEGKRGRRERDEKKREIKKRKRRREKVRNGDK